MTLSLLIRNTRWDFTQKTYVVGILNVTPDSFSDGGEFDSLPGAVLRVDQMMQEGVDMVDVGGESTRPGSESVSAQEEKNRVVPVIRAIRERFPELPISVDTQKAEVAEAALDVGADVVNDVSALRFDPRMVGVVSERHVPVILMHMQGMPKTMQASPTYKDVVVEVIDFLRRQIDVAVKHGVSMDQIIVDPGIGFGKTLDHNVEIFRRLEELQDLGRPVMVGHSRKSMWGALLRGAPPADRIEGTLVGAVAAAERGVQILRVHDVGAVVKTLKVANAIYGKKRILVT